MPRKPVIWLDKVRMTDIPAVGGKNASLGEMLQALTSKGVRVPTGFATTADAYRQYVAANGIEPGIRTALARYHAGQDSLSEAGRTIRALFLHGTLPPSVANAITNAYRQLAIGLGGPDPAVAVRSSATAEDLPEASFAGQQETFLNVRGSHALLEACLRCYASLFTDRAISYRELHGVDHFSVALSIGVQHMVRSDLAGSGVMFSIDPETGFPGAIVISANWGLGETVVQGSADPDRYMVFKPLLADRVARPIIEKRCGAKALKMVFAQNGGRPTRIVETSAAERQGLVLGDDEILELARWASVIEAHYGRPMDMEWAKDGNSGALLIVQARPETVQSRRDASTIVRFRLTERGRALASGAAVGESIATGKAHVIRSPADIDRFEQGGVLVTERTDPDWVPIMKKVSAIVTDHGGATSHAAIVSRELGIPAIVGTGDASTIIQEGQEITVSCAEGESGTVYEGILPFEREAIDLGVIPATRTHMMVNIADPASSFQWWRLPAKGVGLARMEFIINTLIKVHPMALVHPERVDADSRAAIAALTHGYVDGIEYFVDNLARGIARLAAAFHPHPAIVRLSDFKTNEYAHLIGGTPFEPHEENPMLGLRGASRYYDERYREGFALECRALKRVRETLGFTNVIVMVPFCRTPAEADRVLEVMAKHGLRRGEAGLQIYMMCEIPSNVVLAEQFARRFDGFSIGSNDLTQLVLGVDRDSGLLAGLFDERDEAVKTMIADVIARARAAGIKIGICGQAPSNYPDFAAFLVACGIDSISLNPDSFVKTVGAVAAAEGRGVAAARMVKPVPA